MTPPKSAKAAGLDPHFKVRVVIPGAILHLASRNEPRLIRQPGGRLDHVDADWIADHPYGDTLGFIDWSEVSAITWRWTP